MKSGLKNIKRFFFCLAGAFALAAAGMPSMTAQAEEIIVYPGYYSVTVVPTYQNPVTGEIEDIGQNPGIGQMMVQAQVQSVGYVEIEDDGTIWLNTRWNQADANIYAGFWTSTSGSGDWIARDYEVTSQFEVGDYEYMDNVFSATVTDYRFQLSTLDDVVRCSNYVEAMGRECVWYCYITDLSEGVGDEWTSVQAPDMTDYTNSISQIDGNQSGTDNTSGGNNSSAPSVTYSGGRTAAAASSGSSSAPAETAESETKESSETKETGKTPEISDNKKETAKTASADDLLDDASGISGADLKTPETDSGSSSVVFPVVLAGLGGGVIGAVIVGLVMGTSFKKKKDYKDLFEDVNEDDDTDEK